MTSRSQSEDLGGGGKEKKSKVQYGLPAEVLCEARRHTLQKENKREAIV